MTAQEIEQLAIGVETGYYDRDGQPIRVGDEYVYYKLCTRLLPENEWKGAEGNFQKREYTGRVIRYRNKVTFSFIDGVDIWFRLYHKDGNGNILTILVDNEHKAPKLTVEEVLRRREDT